MPSNRVTCAYKARAKAGISSTTIMSAAVVLCLAACVGADQPDVLLKRAEAAYRQGDDKAAIIDVKTALQKNPALMPARALLARLHNRAFDAAAAEKEIGKAVELGFDPQQALPVLGRALLLQNKFQQLLDADRKSVV